MGYKYVAVFDGLCRNQVNLGDIMWETSKNNTAVFLLKTPEKPEAKTRFFIRNLVPDIGGERSSYS
jgi:hypothetical protein